MYLKPPVYNANYNKVVEEYYSILPEYYKANANFAAKLILLEKIVHPETTSKIYSFLFGIKELSKEEILLRGESLYNELQLIHKDMLNRSNTLSNLHRSLAAENHLTTAQKYQIILDLLNNELFFAKIALENYQQFVLLVYDRKHKFLDDFQSSETPFLAVVRDITKYVNLIDTYNEILTDIKKSPSLTKELTPYFLTGLDQAKLKYNRILTHIESDLKKNSSHSLYNLGEDSYLLSGPMVPGLSSISTLNLDYNIFNA